MAHKDLGAAPGGLTDLIRMSENLNARNIPSYAQSVFPKNTYDGVRGIYNYKSSNTRIMDQGISNSMAGGQTHHIVIGDSVSQGATSGIGVVTYDRLHAWSLCMRDQLALSGVPANGTGFVRVNDAGTADARWTQVAATGTWTFTGNTYLAGSTLNATATFVPDRAGTVVEVGYLDSGTATFTVSIDGATSGANFGTFTTAAAGATWKKARISGATIKVGSIITIKITTLGSGLGISGASVFTPGAGLIIDNVAQSGSRAQGTGTATWDDATGGPTFLFKDVSGRARTITDAATTAASNVLTSATAAFTVNDQGEPIDQFPDATGILFPPNTYMVTRTGATTMVMSNNALVTASGKTLGLSRDPSCLHLALGGNDMIALGAAGISAMVTALTNIRNRYPKSDCILHLENEPSDGSHGTTLVTSADELLFQKAMYTLADTLDVPLYDWRDRAGTYTNAYNNGIMNDYQAHMNPGMYADLGSSLAVIIGGGSGQPQYWPLPVYDGDLTNKRYTDAKDVGPVPPFQQAGTLTTRTGTNKWYNDTGRVLTVKAVRASVATAPTGASIIVDVKKNGTTMYTTSGNRPAIAISGTTVAATLPDVLTISAGDYLTVDIAQIGSTIAGADLTVQITTLVV